MKSTVLHCTAKKPIFRKYYIMQKKLVNIDKNLLYKMPNILVVFIISNILSISFKFSTLTKKVCKKSTGLCSRVLLLLCYASTLTNLFLK